MNKEYILFSRWEKINEKDILNKLRTEFLNCSAPDFIERRLLEVFVKERLLASTWSESFKMGRIGKKTFAYDYYMSVKVDGLKDSQIVIIDSFFIGFLSGRDSKKFF